MNRNIAILLVTAAFLLGLGAGFLGPNRAPSPGAPPPEPAITTTLSAPGEPLSRAVLGETGADRHPDFTAIWRSKAVLSLLEGAAPEDMPNLFQRARHDETEARLIAKRWAEIDPLAFLAYLDDNPDGDPPGFDSRRVLFETWTTHDPTSALAAADGADSKKLDSLEAIFAVLMSVDPEIGFRYIEKNPDQTIPIDHSALDWTRTNAAQNARRLAALSSRNNFRNLTLRLASEAWIEEDTPAALEFLAGLAGDRSRARPGAINRWAARDPVAAADYVANEVMGPDRYIAANGVIRGWVKTDAQAAMDWIEANLWGASRQQATKLLLSEVAEYSPEGVLEFLDAMPPTAIRHNGYATLARTWVKKDSEAALAWAHSIESPSEKARIFGALAGGWINGGPWKQAGYHVAQHSDPAQIPVNFTSAIGKKWGSHFPFEALKWVKTLPPEHAGAASHAVFGAWTNRNVGPVVNPLRGLPAGEIRANAHAAVANNYFRQNFGKAAAWYQTLAYEDRQAALSGLSSGQRRRLENLSAGE